MFAFALGTPEILVLGGVCLMATVVPVVVVVLVVTLARSKPSGRPPDDAGNEQQS